MSKSKRPYAPYPVCGLCGGLHFGSVRCPLLSADTCRSCELPIFENQPRFFGDASTPAYGQVFCETCAGKRSDVYRSATVPA